MQAWQVAGHLYPLKILMGFERAECMVFLVLFSLMFQFTA